MQASPPASNAKSLRRLPLVAPSAVMSGKFPRGAEQIAKSCAAGDLAHRALIFTGVSLAQRGLQLCLPPSARPPALDALDTARRWGLEQTDYRTVRDARASLFDAVPELERKTLQVFQKSLQASPQPPKTPLTEHAQRVVQRYLALGVQHSMAGALLCLDAVVDPKKALDIPAEIAGAITYRDLALGPARDPNLLQQAIERAVWEQDRLSACADMPQGAVALQLYHEYLGVHFNERSQAHRMYLDRFTNWALPAK